MKPNAHLIFAASLLAPLAAVQSDEAKPAKPNIIFILANVVAR